MTELTQPVLALLTKMLRESHARIDSIADELREHNQAMNRLSDEMDWRQAQVFWLQAEINKAQATEDQRDASQ